MGEQLSFPTKYSFVAHVEESRGHSFTYAKLRATSLDNINKAIKHYFKQYLPQGYSTELVKKPVPDLGNWE